MIKFLIALVGFVAISRTETTCSSAGVYGYLISEQSRTPTPNVVNFAVAIAACSKAVLEFNTGCCDLPSTTTFKCTNNGYFPNPTNCDQYYICIDGVASTYQCPPNYIYDSVNYKCRPKRCEADCSTIDCNTVPVNSYIVYSANKAYYALCGLKSGVSPELMFRCEDTVNFQFNPDTLRCEFACKAPGWYLDYTNSQNYYVCYKSDTGLVSEVRTCPTSYIFDTTQNLCIQDVCTVVIPTSTSTATPPL